MSKAIRWGIIGCGAVTEKKSGPALQKVAGSALHMVMRRTPALAADYALRHGVPHWTSQAEELILHPEVDAIYIATPPDSHLAYTRLALQAGKPVYVEKPMVRTYAEALAMLELCNNYSPSVTVAHYRRFWPLFAEVKRLLQAGAIGTPLTAELRCLRAPVPDTDLHKPEVQWRLQPVVSGGGLFHDLAPHQLDLLYYFLGPIRYASGTAYSHDARYPAHDTVCGIAQFECGLQFTGTWCFCVAPQQQDDTVTITGTKGMLRFSMMWQRPLIVQQGDAIEELHFDPPAHNQWFMVEQLIAFLQGQRSNPCSVAEAAATLRVMDSFTGGAAW